MFGFGSRQTTENRGYAGQQTYIPDPWETEYGEGVAGAGRTGSGGRRQQQPQPQYQEGVAGSGQRQQQSTVPKEGFLAKAGKYGNLAINALFLAQLAQSFLPSSPGQPSTLYPPPGYNPYL